MQEDLYISLFYKQYFFAILELKVMISIFWPKNVCSFYDAQ